MRISHRKRLQPIGPTFHYNAGIRAPEVRVIDENETHLGVFPIQEALAIAQEKGLDLVEINPATSPPVTKITNFGQFKYQKEKEARKQKAHQKRIELKGIRLSLRIGEGDLGVRRAQAEKFLGEGDKVRVEIILKGRERQHADLAGKIISDFCASLVETRVEQQLQRQAGVLSMIVAKK
jgi:translation initiation factor IF-3